MPVSPPSHAAIVIIGGGVVGCSFAHHLVKLGLRDALLLERKQLYSGTTWHAAFINTGADTIEVACERVEAMPSLRSLYDPKSLRIRACCPARPGFSGQLEETNRAVIRAAYRGVIHYNCDSK
jgi:cation diffusion facilitator CzcD-associated flavoprotein CzcO